MTIIHRQEIPAVIKIPPTFIRALVVYKVISILKEGFEDFFSLLRVSRVSGVLQGISGLEVFHLHELPFSFRSLFASETPFLAQGVEGHGLASTPRWARRARPTSPLLGPGGGIGAVAVCGRWHGEAPRAGVQNCASDRGVFPGAQGWRLGGRAATRAGQHPPQPAVGPWHLRQHPGVRGTICSGSLQPSKSQSGLCAQRYGCAPVCLGCSWGLLAP